MTSLALLTAAILFYRPSTPIPKAVSYAKIIDTRSAAFGIDPLLIIAMVQHESNWIPTIVHSSGNAHGFGQILITFRPACAKDKDPIHAPSSACLAEKKNLLDGAYNLHAMFDIIETWRITCKAKTGISPTEAGWLAAYAGLNRVKGTFCGLHQAKLGKWSPIPTPKVVRQFLDLRHALRLHLASLPHS